MIEALPVPVQAISVILPVAVAELKVFVAVAARLPPVSKAAPVGNGSETALIAVVPLGTIVTLSVPLARVRVLIVPLTALYTPFNNATRLALPVPA